MTRQLCATCHKPTQKTHCPTCQPKRTPTHNKPDTRTRNDRPPRKHIPNHTRQDVYNELTCHLCGNQVPHQYRTIDHITPKSHGGTDHRNNLRLACQTCNYHRSTKTIH